MSDIALVVRRTMRAPVASVFDAWVRPEQLGAGGVRGP